MHLFIVRHGIAIERGAPKCPPDPERFLTEEGIAKTQQSARGVVALGASADLLLSSPYVRSLQTAEIFAEALGFPAPKIRKSEALLPGADPLLIFRELAREKLGATVFLFGHAPQLDDLIAYALGSQHAFTALKKTGVAQIDLTRISPPAGILVWVAPPKMLRRSGK
ncbi:MAG: histidine phosphatase family protein [Acidobacteriia bacterium]|nr:histidine phosphatase family protein [Terriglobia bacterium]